VFRCLGVRKARRFRESDCNSQLVDQEKATLIAKPEEQESEQNEMRRCKKRCAARRDSQRRRVASIEGEADPTEASPLAPLWFGIPLDKTALLPPSDEPET
jgi:hypothetical protein